MSIEEHRNDIDNLTFDQGVGGSNPLRLTILDER